MRRPSSQDSNMDLKAKRAELEAERDRVIAYLNQVMGKIALIDELQTPAIEEPEKQADA